MDLFWQSNPLLFNMFSRLVMAFLPRSKCLLISWLQWPSAVVLEPPENKVSHCFSHCFPISLPWSDGTGCHDLRQSHPPLWTCIYTVVCVLLSQLATAWNALPLLPSVPLNCVTQALCLEKPSLTPFSTFFIKLQCLVLSRNPEIIIE